MIKAVNLIKRFNDTVFQYRKILIIFFNERMVTIMGKNGNIKKALATNNNDNLYRIAELIESVHLNAVCEFDAMTEWDTVHHFDAVKKSGTSKNAYQYDIDKYESLKAERSAYRESLPFVANYKADNTELSKLQTAFVGNKKSARYALVQDCYNAYVESARNMSATRYNLEQAFRTLLLHKNGLCLHTDAKTTNDIVSRLVPVFGLKVATKTDHAKNENIGGMAVMSETAFKKTLVRALASMAMTGKVDISAC